MQQAGIGFVGEKEVERLSFLLAEVTCLFNGVNGMIKQVKLCIDNELFFPVTEAGQIQSYRLVTCHSKAY